MKTYPPARRPEPSTKKLLRSLGLCLLGVLLAGCPAQKQQPEPPAPAPMKKITVRGSNTIGEELAPRLIAAHKKTHGDMVFDSEFKGTGYGLGALSSDSGDIAAASRIVSTNELDLLKGANVELNEYIIGAYAVAVVVNAGNPVANLTREQVRGIFTGAIQNWKDVGGADAPIHLYIRNPVSGTYLGFQELAMDNQPYSHAQKALTSYAEIVQAVAQDAGGIGYTSLDPKLDGAKGLSIEGVEPTAANVNKGSYPYTRVLRFYTNKTKESAEAKDFIQFALSAAGQDILVQTGFVPKP